MIDLWRTQREQATEEGGLKILRRGVGGKISVLIWQPKAIKPCANYLFPNEERREAFIARQIEGLKTHRQMIDDRKKSRAGTAEDVAKVQVGSIFHNSWGYEQTNCDFYQVISMSGRHVTLREIASETVPGSEGYMRCSLVAVKDQFMEKAKPFTKLVQFSRGQPHVSMRHGWCGLWDGQPETCTWYG